MCFIGSKVPYFFFLGKVCGHSLTRFQELLYFFFPKTGKKNTRVYFFFLKKFTCHSLNFSGGALIKNKGESYIFPKMPILTPFYVVFFFSEVCIFFFLYFFFSWKKFKLHSLTRFKPCIFFFRHRKKKYSVFTHSISDENVAKVNFSKEKKNTVPLP